MKTVEYYVKGLFRNIKRTKEIDDQVEELTCHISDRVSDLVSNGIHEDEALEKTIVYGVRTNSWTLEYKEKSKCIEAKPVKKQ